MSSKWRPIRPWPWVFFLGAAVGFSPLARAAGVVTNSTFAELVKAMEGGGLVKLEGGGAITFEYTIDVVFDTVLDAGDNRVILSGNQERRLFTVASGIEFTLEGVDLQRGSNFVGGAILNDGGTVIARGCNFAQNQAKGADGTSGKSAVDREGEARDGSDGTDGSGAQGGAIYSRGTLHLEECQFESNEAVGGNGGSGGNGGAGTWSGGNGGDGADGGVGWGGAIYNTGSVWLTNCSFVANISQGGLGGEGGTNATSISSGYPGGGGIGGGSAGGAIYNAGKLHLVNSTFSENEAQGGDAGSHGGFVNGGAQGDEGPGGGGAYGGAIGNLGTVTVLQCTFYANNTSGGNAGDGGQGTFGGAEGGDGGDAYGGGLDNTGTAMITNCTFAAGTAVGGQPGSSTTEGVMFNPQGEAGFSRGGNIAARSGIVRIKNSIVAYTEPAGGKNSYGTLLDSGYNISSDDSCRFTSIRSRNSTDPKLGALDDYGGPTETMSLLVASPALDKAAPVDGLDADQRGSARPVGLGPDIGAYEAAVFVISGRVLNGTEGLPGVKMTLTSTNASFTTTTDAVGLFVFENLFADVYRLAPPKTGPGFSPPFRTIHLDWLGEDAVNQDFSGITSEITDLKFEGQQRIITAQGAAKIRYLLQATSDFSNWTKVATNTADASGSLQFIDGRTGIGPQQFYRVEQP